MDDDGRSGVGVAAGSLVWVGVVCGVDCGGTTELGMYGCMCVCWATGTRGPLGGGRGWPCWCTVSRGWGKRGPGRSGWSATPVLKIKYCSLIGTALSRSNPLIDWHAVSVESIPQ